MIWVKEFKKDSDDPDCKIAAKMYHLMKDSDEKTELGKHYECVLKEGNLAEKEVFDLINDIMHDVKYHGVANIRINGYYDKENKWPSEFDFILEEKCRVLYINVKHSDESNQQKKQCLRHEKILNRILPKNKELHSLLVITSKKESMEDFEDKLKKYKEEFTGEDDVFCRILNDIDSPAAHYNCIMKKFNIAKSNFTEDNYNKFTTYVYEIIKGGKKEMKKVRGIITGFEEGKSNKTDYIEVKTEDDSEIKLYIDKGKANKSIIGKTIGYDETDIKYYGKRQFLKGFDENKHIVSDTI